MTEPRSTDPASRRTRIATVLRTVAPGLVIDVVLPIVVYALLVRAGTSELVALLWSALPPVLNMGWQAWRTRRLTGVGVIVVASIAVGVVAALMTGDPRVAVARDAVPNVAMALALGGSLLLGRRPLVYFVLRAGGETYRPDLRERMAQAWATNAGFRHVLRRATGVSAVVLLAEAALRLLLATTLPVDVAMPVVQVQSFVVWAALSLFLVRSVRRVASAQAPDSTSPRSLSRSAVTVAASRSNSSSDISSSRRSENTTSAPVG